MALRPRQRSEPPGEALHRPDHIFPATGCLVQAAIGAVPLTMGVPGGEIILAVAVLSILLTAAPGAILIRYAGERCLEKEP